jgi:hypothetical protein
MVDILWPHDSSGTAADVLHANLANLDALLLDAVDPSVSVKPQFDSAVWLLTSVDRGPARAQRGREVLSVRGDVVYPRWLFDDVDVSRASSAESTYYFRVAVAGAQATSNVWAHGIDGRTTAPTPDIPAASALDCQ